MMRAAMPRYATRRLATSHATPFTSTSNNTCAHGSLRSQSAALSTSTDGRVMHQLRERASHIDLEEVDTLIFRAPRANLWVPPGSRAVFGGQVLGQALHAALRTVDGALGPFGERRMTPVSLHSYFLLPGEAESDIVFQVTRTADLRSFTTRTVDAVQRGRTIFQMQAQFARTGQPALEHASSMPTDVLPPEECPSMRDVLAGLMDRAPAALRPLIEKQLVAPVEMRWANGVAPDLLDPDPARTWPARQALWLKLHDPIGARERLDECCAAYMSDQFLLATTLLPHRIQFPSPKLAAIATLDHSMWFHGEIKADDWWACPCLGATVPSFSSHTCRLAGCFTTWTRPVRRAASASRSATCTGGTRARWSSAWRSRGSFAPRSPRSPPRRSARPCARRAFSTTCSAFCPARANCDPAESKDVYIRSCAVS